MTLTIQVLLILLLLASTVAVVRLYFVLGDVRNTLAGVDETRKELTATVERLNTLVSEEITPTLQTARETLAHLEVTTRALAETTQFARQIAGKAAPATAAVPLLGSAGNPIAQFITQQGTKLAVSVLSSVGAGLWSGVRGLFGKKQKPALPPASDGDVKSRELLPPADSDALVPAESSARASSRVRSGRNR